jgi:hypothetical protein
VAAGVERTETLDLVQSLYQCHPLSEVLTERRSRESEWLMRVARRKAELDLLRWGKVRLLPWMVHGAKRKDRAKRLQEKLEASFDQCRTIPMSRKLYRHRCYSRTLQGLAVYLADPSADSLNRAQRLLHEAESQLVRDAGAAERQALAVLRLHSAMLHIERAERVLWKVHKIEVGSKIWSEVGSLLSTAVFDLEETGNLMGSGRGELRWRQMYLLYQARYWLLHARLQESDSGRKIRSLFRAARFITSGLTNCGRLTDRRVIFTSWWKEIKDEWTKSHKDDANAGKHLYQRLGIDWWPKREEPGGRVSARPLALPVVVGGRDEPRAPIVDAQPQKGRGGARRGSIVNR